MFWRLLKKRREVQTIISCRGLVLFRTHTIFCRSQYSRYPFLSLYGCSAPSYLIFIIPYPHKIEHENPCLLARFTKMRERSITLCWFHICGNVYARKQFEKPDITKERGKRVDMCTYGRIDVKMKRNKKLTRRFYPLDGIHEKPEGTWGGEN